MTLLANILSLASSRTSRFSPAMLFAASEPGVWYDPTLVANTDWRRNLLTFTEQFDNAAWQRTSTTIAANSTIAPDGTVTADTFTDDATNGPHNAIESVAPAVAGQTYTMSLYAKASTASVIQVLGRLATMGTNVWANFNLANGTVGATGPSTTASIVNVGNGWYRCIVTGAATGTGTGILAFLLTNSDANVARQPSYAGTGTSVFIWGAQVELGSTATTYNPTTVKNLLGFSEAFDNAAWTKGNVGIVTGAAANPVNGLFNAQKLMEDTATTSHQTFQVTTVISGTSYTFSVYAKQAVGSRTLTLRCQLTPVNFQGATFDLATGASSQLGTGITASASAVGNGWYRCSITFTASASGGNLCYVNATASGTVTYTGDGNSGIFIYGAQLSDSASLDPYVPTPGAAPSSTAYYGPRFDFDPVTRQPRGILIEEQRTNLFTYSEQFDNANWPKQEVTVTANSTTSPNGTVDADTLIPTTTNTSIHRLFITTAIGAAAHSFSIYAKAAGYSWLKLRLSTGTRYANFNVSTGALGVAGAGVTSSITAVGNGWYRCTMTATTVGSETAFIYPMTTDNADVDPVSFAGDGTSGILIWGAQLEAGGFATSYIPTIASTVTRSVDVATISGSLFSQWYRQDAGTFVASCSMLALSTATTQEILETDSGSVANAITLRANNTAGQTSSTATTASVSQGFIDISGAAANTLQNVALGVSTNNTAMVRNGGAVGSDATYAVPTGLTRITFGTRTNSGAPLNGHIRSIRYIPARAADFQLQALTT